MVLDEAADMTRQRAADERLQVAEANGRDRLPADPDVEMGNVATLSVTGVHLQLNSALVHNGRQRQSLNVYV